MSESDKRSDEDLVEAERRALPGDHTHYEELVRRHQGSIVANCRHISGSADDAEDLAQEVFVKTFFALRKFEGRSLFRTWLQRIKVNHCLNFLRKGKGKVFVDVDDPVYHGEEKLQTAGGPEAERGLERDRIRAILEEMPDTLRIPLVLCDLDGYSYQEIADELELGLSAVKMRIKRGRELFRQLSGEAAEAGGTAAEGTS